MQGHPVIGKYEDRRYQCCNCKKAFSESNPFVQRYMQMSITNIQHLFSKLKDSLNYTTIAKECDTSVTTFIRYFKTFSHATRKKVKFIVMDMSNQFKKVMSALFPHAHIICDRYHVCRLVDWAIERVRKREQHKLVAHSRMVKQNKRVLIKRPDQLTEDDLIKLEEICKVSDDLRKAYGLKLAFINIFVTYEKNSHL